MSETSTQRAAKKASTRAAVVAKTEIKAASAPAREAVVPDAARAYAESTQKAYERTKDTMEGSVELMERAFDKAGQGAVEMNAKVIEIAQRNMNSGFELARDLAGAKDIAQIVALQSAFAGRQAETFVGQAREVQTLAEKVARDAMEPFKAHVSRALQAFGSRH